MNCFNYFICDRWKLNLLLKYNIIMDKGISFYMFDYIKNIKKYYYFNFLL